MKRGGHSRRGSWRRFRVRLRTAGRVFKVLLSELWRLVGPKPPQPKHTSVSDQERKQAQLDNARKLRDYETDRAARMLKYWEREKELKEKRWAKEQAEKSKGRVRDYTSVFGGGSK